MHRATKTLMISLWKNCLRGLMINNPQCAAVSAHVLLNVSSSMLRHYILSPNYNCRLSSNIITRHRAIQALADISRSGYVVIATKPVHCASPPNSAQLEGTPTIPPSYIQVLAVVWECGEGQTSRYTDTQTAVTNIRFASATPHLKCN